MMMLVIADIDTNDTRTYGLVRYSGLVELSERDDPLSLWIGPKQQYRLVEDFFLMLFHVDP